MIHLTVIDVPRGADQRALVWRAVDNEPRINGDTMTADAGAGMQDVYARVAVCKPDNLPHIKAHMVGNNRQFIGKGDVDVAECVFDQLCHFSGPGIGGNAFTANKALVKGQRLSRAAGCYSAYRPVIVGQFFKDGF